MNSLNGLNNISMLTELYEFTTADGYFNSPVKDTVAYFDLFFRKVPDKGGFAIISRISNLPVTYGRYRREHRYSRMSR